MSLLQIKIMSVQADLDVFAKNYSKYANRGISRKITEQDNFSINSRLSNSY